MLLSFLFLVSIAIAAPESSADGSYEADVPFNKASPAWMGGSPFNRDAPSLVDWTAVRDGKLIVQVGAPKSTGVYLAPPPIESTSYTVEAKYRILATGKTHRPSNPFILVVSRKDAGYHWLRTGWGISGKWQKGYAHANLVLDDEWASVLEDDSLIDGKWLTLRLVVRDNEVDQTCTVYMNGKRFAQVTTAQRSRRLACLYLHCNDPEGAWELDYVRWKNKALPPTVALTAPLTEEEVARRREQALRQKIEALFD